MTGAPTGIWLGASYALGRLVPADEPYPHICGIEVQGRVTGRKFRVGRLWTTKDGSVYCDCAACAERAQPARQPEEVPTGG